MANGNGTGKMIRVFWMVLAILLTIGAYAGSYGVLKATVSNHSKRIERNEAVINRIDKSIVGIEKDIKHILNKVK